MFKKIFMIVGIVLAVSSVPVLLVVGGDFFLIQTNQVKNLNDFSSYDELKENLPLQGGIYAVYDSFLSVEDENGKTITKYYLVPAQEEKFFAMKIEGNQNFKMLDALSDATASYVAGKTDSIDADEFKIEGVLKASNQEIKKAALEWFQRSGLLGTSEDSAIEEHILPYVLEPLNFTETAIVFYCATGQLLLGLTLSIILSLKIRKDKRKTNANY